MVYSILPMPLLGWQVVPKGRNGRLSTTIVRGFWYSSNGKAGCSTNPLNELEKKMELNPRKQRREFHFSFSCMVFKWRETGFEYQLSTWKADISVLHRKKLTFRLLCQLNNRWNKSILKQPDLILYFFISGKFIPIKSIPWKSAEAIVSLIR